MRRCGLLLPYCSNLFPCTHCEEATNNRQHYYRVYLRLTWGGIFIKIFEIVYNICAILIPKRAFESSQKFEYMYPACIFMQNCKHTFNSPLSGAVLVSRYQRGKTSLLDFTEARDGEWQWHQLGHMQVFTLLQTDNHASTPPLGFCMQIAFVSKSL